jgi:hypothetical protein
MKVEVEWQPLPPRFALPINSITKARGKSKPDKPGEKVIKVTYPAWGQKVGIYDCCLQYEVYVDIQDGQVMLCEWHAEGCEIGQISRDAACHGDLAPGAYCGTCGMYNPDEPGE